ncbi:hypothetical protein ADUPG1_008598 [Aduncisulcus paluster]|uniref:Uncharacterized protein n=1 Tax=Aduncisulcus paluster TaxID=2918883 RepID=A0ABQ5KSJ2_9EUKA|nr:hypothetical protein ADUPG1_008598 [Aduncisulcus paluster]
MTTYPYLKSIGPLPSVGTTFKGRNDPVAVSLSRQMIAIASGIQIIILSYDSSKCDKDSCALAYSNFNQTSFQASLHKVTSLEFCHSGVELAVGDQAGNVIIYLINDALEPIEISRRSCSTNDVLSLAWSEDEKKVIVGSISHNSKPGLAPCSVFLADSGGSAGTLTGNSKCCSFVCASPARPHTYVSVGGRMGGKGANLYKGVPASFHSKLNFVKKIGCKRDFIGSISKDKGESDVCSDSIETVSPSSTPSFSSIIPICTCAHYSPCGRYCLVGDVNCKIHVFAVSNAVLNSQGHAVYLGSCKMPHIADNTLYNVLVENSRTQESAISLSIPCDTESDTDPEFTESDTDPELKEHRCKEVLSSLRVITTCADGHVCISKLDVTYCEMMDSASTIVYADIEVERTAFSRNLSTVVSSLGIFSPKKGYGQMSKKKKVKRRAKAISYIRSGGKVTSSVDTGDKISDSEQVVSILYDEDEPKSIEELEKDVFFVCCCKQSGMLAFLSYSSLEITYCMYGHGQGIKNISSTPHTVVSFSWNGSVCVWGVDDKVMKGGDSKRKDARLIPLPAEQCVLKDIRPHGDSTTKSDSDSSSSGDESEKKSVISLTATFEKRQEERIKRLEMKEKKLACVYDSSFYPFPRTCQIIHSIRTKSYVIAFSTSKDLYVLEERVLSSDGTILAPKELMDVKRESKEDGYDEEFTSNACVCIVKDFHHGLVVSCAYSNAKDDSLVLSDDTGKIWEMSFKNLYLDDEKRTGRKGSVEKFLIGKVPTSPTSICKHGPLIALSFSRTINVYSIIRIGGEDDSAKGMSLQLCFSNKNEHRSDIQRCLFLPSSEPCEGESSPPTSSELPSSLLTAGNRVVSWKNDWAISTSTTELKGASELDFVSSVAAHSLSIVCAEMAGKYLFTVDAGGSIGAFTPLRRNIGGIRTDEFVGGASCGLVHPESGVCVACSARGEMKQYCICEEDK